MLRVACCCLALLAVRVGGHASDTLQDCAKQLVRTSIHAPHSIVHTLGSRLTDHTVVAIRVKSQSHETLSIVRPKEESNTNNRRSPAS